MSAGTAAPVAGAGRQRGVVLFVALIVLVVMTLAGLALVRQMGAGTSISGNVAFKEGATSVADRGIEEARQWILTNVAILASDSPANGYYSSWGTSVDPTTYNWSPTVSAVIAADEAQTGNTTRFIVHRLCETPNLSANDPAQRCSDRKEANAGGSKSGGSYGGMPAPPATNPFFRITTRVEGPRNTISYTQVLIN